MHKITPFITFVDQAEAAVALYTSLFGGKTHSIMRAPDGTPGTAAGKVLTIEFEIAGQRYTAMNGGDHFKLTDAFSISVSVETQQEIDEYTEKLTAGGGHVVQCGWLVDRFGLSWQIVPEILPKMLADKDKAKQQRVLQAMLQMKKLDIAALKRAYEG